MIESDLLWQFVTEIGLNKNQYNYYLLFAINFYKLLQGACNSFYKNDGCESFSY